MNSTTSRSHIDVHLIEKALALTGKNEWDMCELTIVDKSDDKITTKGKFSIEKFYAYLLSPEFIEKYEPKDGYWGTVQWNVGEAIYEHQKGNPEPLLSLLEKI